MKVEDEALFRQVLFPFTRICVWIYSKIDALCSRHLMHVLNYKLAQALEPCGEKRTCHDALHRHVSLQFAGAYNEHVAGRV
jgi:hypothetical protein